MALQIICRSNLSSLADIFISNIQSHWRSPFDVPNVICSQRKLIQLLKLRWVRQSGSSNNESPKIIAGLNYQSFESYFFDLLNTEQLERLDSARFKQSMCTVLHRIASQYDELRNYLYNDDGELDQIKCFQLASHMTAVFADYERKVDLSAHDVLAEAIFDQFNSNSQRTSWEKELYIQSTQALSDRYTTLARLFVQHPEKLKSKGEIFIFAGYNIAPLHKHIIEEYQKTNDVYLYIQNVNARDNEINDKWSAFARDSLKYASVASVQVDQQQPLSLEDHLHSLKVTITQAPSAEREVENLYAQLCNLLIHEQTGSYQGKQYTYHTKSRDVIVVCPNLEAYRPAIMRVFDEEKLTANQENGFPKAFRKAVHLRYFFADHAASDSLTIKALKDLFEVIDNGTIMRQQFFSLMRNRLVQQVRGIDPDEVNVWETWVDQMNTFRDRPENDSHQARYDWATAAKRMLMARFTNNEFGGSAPFEDITTGDSSSVFRFINCIRDLNAFIQLSKQNVVISAVAEQLEKWLFAPEIPACLKSEHIIYLNVRAALALVESNNNITWNYLRATLIDAAESSEYENSDLFIHGITFVKFNPDCPISAKHCFLLGANASDFPGMKTQSSLNLRTIDDSKSTLAHQAYGFMCQVMNTSQHLYISYVNRDLKKDAELYESAIVHDFVRLGQAQDQVAFDEHYIGIDKEVSWDDVYTITAFRKNKIACRVPYSPLDEMDNKTKLESRNSNKAMSFKSLQSFLKNPFKFQLNQIMKQDDISEDISFDAFEPIKFDELESMKYINKLVGIMCGIDEDGIASADEYEHILRTQNKLPDEKFLDQSWDVLKTIADKLVNGDPEERQALLEFDQKVQEINDSINELKARDPLSTQDAEELEKKKAELENVKKQRKDIIKSIKGWLGSQEGQCLDSKYVVNVLLNNKLEMKNDNRAWLLTGTIEFSKMLPRTDDGVPQGTVTNYIAILSKDIDKKTKDKPKYYVEAYMHALAWLASRSNESDRVVCGLFDYNDEKSEDDSISVTTKLWNELHFDELKPTMARDRFNSIYELAFGLNVENYYESHFIPVTWYPTEFKGKNEDAYNFYIKQMEGSYNYLSIHDLVNIKKTCGFTRNYFYKQWYACIRKMMERMPELRPYIFEELYNKQRQEEEKNKQEEA